MDVGRLARKVAGAIQGDELGVADRAHLVEQADFLDGLVYLVEDPEEAFGWNGIQGVADLIVRGDGPNLKEGGGIVGTAGLPQGFLVGQEGGALGEKDREGRQNKVGHLIPGVGAGAGVREILRAGAQLFNKMIKGAQLHGRQRCLKGGICTSYDCVTIVTNS